MRLPFGKPGAYVLLFCFILLGLLSCFTNPAFAASNRVSPDVEEPVLYYFWGLCPVCAKPADHLDQFAVYPIRIEVYEVFRDAGNRALYDRFRAELGIAVHGFPAIVFQDRYWLGFSPAVQAELHGAIEAFLKGETAPGRESVIKLPFAGEINLQAAPILLATVLIAFLDGFNPCSLFVLTFLLAIIVHSASRKRILLVGLTFLAVTASVYGVFILGVLNVMAFAARLFLIRNIVALLVIVMGLVGIKDFLFFRQGITFSIPERYKAKYYKQVRQVFYTGSAFPMIAATAIMALGIALIELPCTAGFPFAWSSLVTGLDLPLPHFVLLFAVYLFIYLSVELVIFAIAVIRMRSFKLTEEGGRFLKLLAGSLMLVLGLILLLKPEYMENLSGVLLAFGVTALLMLTVYQLKKLMDGRGA